jgi:hypothetical protein
MTDYKHLTDAERTADADTLRRALEEARAHNVRLADLLGYWRIKCERTQRWAALWKRAAKFHRGWCNFFEEKAFDFKNQAAKQSRRAAVAEAELATLRAERDALRAAAYTLYSAGALDIQHAFGETQELWDARETMIGALRAQRPGPDNWSTRRAAAFERHCAELHGADFEVCDDPQCRAVVEEEVCRGLLDARAWSAQWKKAAKFWRGEYKEMYEFFDAAYKDAEYFEDKLDKAEAERGALRAAVEAVEWVETPVDDEGINQCPWCLYYECLGHHAPDCLRQAALGIGTGGRE